MAIAHTIQTYLKTHRVHPERIVHHPHSGSSAETAEMAHLSGHVIAKGVVVKAGDDFVLAVIPASYNVSLSQLEDYCDAPLSLAEEDELSTLFPDCDKGAVPALGMAYQLDTYVDQALFSYPEIYFEGGDHESLVALNRKQFRSIFEAAVSGIFSVSQPT